MAVYDACKISESYVNMCDSPSPNHQLELRAWARHAQRLYHASCPFAHPRAHTATKNRYSAHSLEDALHRLGYSIDTPLLDHDQRRDWDILLDDLPHLPPPPG